MINIILTILAILVIIILWVTIYDTNRFILVKHSFSDKRIRKSMRAVVITDLHNKSFGRNNELLLAAIREQTPDFILVGGDIRHRTLDCLDYLLGRIKSECVTEEEIYE